MSISNKKKFTFEKITREPSIFEVARVNQINRMSSLNNSSMNDPNTQTKSQGGRSERRGEGVKNSHYSAAGILDHMVPNFRTKGVD